MSRSERYARLIGIGLVLAVLLAMAVARWAGNTGAIVVHARLPEQGGWIPGDLSAVAGEALTLRLTSDDVVHGFAIGQTDSPPVDVQPGKFTEVTLLFDQPGKYTYYCTRWCGVNHWRMRGTIEVSGGSPLPDEQKQPLYVQLGLDIDAEHHAENLPARKPSAGRGTALGLLLPKVYLEPDYYRAHSPEAVWNDLRRCRLGTTASCPTQGLSDAELWDLVASIWQANIPTQTLEIGQGLYRANCAACHGTTGKGDGVFAAESAGTPPGEHLEISPEEIAQPPANFTEARHMLAASPAHLQGKIIRGGMGTGMPYWGPIFTEEQTWALVAYLWTFQFELEEQP